MSEHTSHDHRAGGDSHHTGHRAPTTAPEEAHDGSERLPEPLPEPLGELGDALAHRVPHVTAVLVRLQDNRASRGGDESDLYLRVFSREVVPAVEEEPFRIVWSGTAYVWGGGPDRGAQIGRNAEQATEQGRVFARTGPGDAARTLCRTAIAAYLGEDAPGADIVTAIARHGMAAIATALTTTITEVLDVLATAHGLHIEQIIDHYLGVLFDEHTGDLHDMVAGQLRRNRTPAISDPVQQERFLSRLVLVNTMAMFELAGGTPPPP